MIKLLENDKNWRPFGIQWWVQKARWGSLPGSALLGLTLAKRLCPWGLDQMSPRTLVVLTPEEPVLLCPTPTKPPTCPGPPTPQNWGPALWL